MLFGVPVWIRLFIQALSFGYKQAAAVKCSACSEVLSLHIRLNDFTGVLNWWNVSCDILDLSSNLVSHPFKTLRFDVLSPSFEYLNVFLEHSDSLTSMRCIYVAPRNFLARASL
ncbi:uncharacterized protein BJ212DRAFT_611478 [Suillus subaureus]|uniref:Secreted protein n=1 Tax=Suillus subaureus TaxID=48587 RepID=A0A9P7ATS6_9AGAM|nr:uncharacterized protein BJ212DRAFT_611478 [Suillus subaureus]KAG1794982.1 hypothetical protein BJ212DRAFT_611478 [Suillus subaureus]